MLKGLGLRLKVTQNNENGHSPPIFYFIFLPFFETVSLCRLGWHQTHRVPPASAFQMLALKMSCDHPECSGEKKIEETV